MLLNPDNLFAITWYYEVMAAVGILALFTIHKWAPAVFTGMAAQLGGWTTRVILMGVVFTCLYFLVAGIFEAIVTFGGQSRPWEAFKTYFPAAYKMALFVSYLFALDVLLGIMPPYIAAQFILKRLTIPLL